METVIVTISVLVLVQATVLLLAAVWLHYKTNKKIGKGK